MSEQTPFSRQMTKPFFLSLKIQYLPFLYNISDDFNIFLISYMIAESLLREVNLYALFGAFRLNFQRLISRFF